jgi:hypothetical protein
MRLVSLLFLAIGLIVAAPAYGRTPVPIVEFPDLAVGTSSGVKPTVEQVRQAIVKAAGEKDWALAKQAEDRFVATRVIKGKHTIVTTISFSAEKYSVKYESSENMNYQVNNGKALIHPNYNVWAQDLVGAIRFEISKL